MAATQLPRWLRLASRRGAHAPATCMGLSTSTRARCRPHPRDLVAEHLSELHVGAYEALLSDYSGLKLASQYYFDGKGKMFRPMLTILTGRACRAADAPDITGDLWRTDAIDADQRTIALITEMIHTASLVHDDVIDEATTRRGMAAVNVRFSEKECVLAGDFILARATKLLAGLGNVRVIEIFAQVIEDLVRGELMQLGTAQDPKKRFSNYICKSEAKTASLLARSCRSVAVLANCTPVAEECAFQYGRHLGLAFQLVDDMLDVVQSSADMGKETSVDMKLGLATAPVLFASEEFPELVPLIVRQFKQPGDAAVAHDLIKKSNGIERTRELAAHHIDEAIANAKQLPGTDYHESLVTLADMVLNRSS